MRWQNHSNVCSYCPSDFSFSFILLLIPLSPNACVFFVVVIILVFKSNKLICLYFQYSIECLLINHRIFEKKILTAICLFGLVCDLCNFPYPSLRRPKIIVCQQISNVPRIKWLNPRGSDWTEWELATHTHADRERETCESNIINKEKLQKRQIKSSAKIFTSFTSNIFYCSLISPNSIFYAWRMLMSEMVK